MMLAYSFVFHDTNLAETKGSGIRASASLQDSGKARDTKIDWTRNKRATAH